MTEPSADFIHAFAQLSDGPVSDERVALHELSESIRALTNLMIDRDLPLEHVKSAAKEIATIAAAMESLPQRTYRDMLDGALGFMDFSPVAGLANPIAPPLVLRVDGDVVRGEVTFEQTHEGPPGHVHGGMLAAAFDELLGMTQSLSGAPGMTGRLTIHYRRPTPLRTPIRFVGRVENVSGRKISTVGESLVEVDGEWLVTAECEGLFISIPHERFAMMAAGGGF